VSAFRLAEEYPAKVAGGIQSQSGAFQWTPLNLDNTDVVTPQALKKIAPGARIWLDFGIFEDKLATSNQTAVQNLQDLHRQFEWMVSPEGHNWTAWRHRMVRGLLYLLRPDQASGH
jgi:enterochelin esterase-like enzyme